MPHQGGRVGVDERPVDQWEKMRLVLAEAAAGIATGGQRADLHIRVRE
jgi:hypothetical protein